MNWKKLIDFEICHHLANPATCNQGNFSWYFDIDDDHILFYNRSIGANPSQGLGDGAEPLCYLKYVVASDANTPPKIEVLSREC